jgi:hypothetical protein
MNALRQLIYFYGKQRSKELQEADKLTEGIDLYVLARNVDSVVKKFSMAEAVAERGVIYYQLVFNHPITSRNLFMFSLSYFSKTIRTVLNSTSEFYGMSNRQFFNQVFRLGGVRVSHLIYQNNLPVMQTRIILGAYSDDAQLLTLPMIQDQIYYRTKKAYLQLECEFEVLGERPLTPELVQDVLYPELEQGGELPSRFLTDSHLIEELKKIKPTPHFFGALYQVKSK